MSPSVEVINVHTKQKPFNHLAEIPDGKISQLPNWLPIKSIVRLQCPCSPSRCQAEPHDCGVHSQTKLPPGKKNPLEPLTMSKPTSAREVINDERVCNVETFSSTGEERTEASLGSNGAAVVVVVETRTAGVKEMEREL